MGTRTFTDYFTLTGYTSSPRFVSISAGWDPNEPPLVFRATVSWDSAGNVSGTWTLSGHIHTYETTSDYQSIESSVAFSDSGTFAPDDGLSYHAGHFVALSDAGGFVSGDGWLETVYSPDSDYTNSDYDKDYVVNGIYMSSMDYSFRIDVGGIPVDGIGLTDFDLATDPTNLPGTSGDDVLVGGLGNDTITAGAGNDSLYGDAGDDTLDAGTGNDILDGGLGADSMVGGSGNDLYYVDNSGDVVHETDNTVTVSRGQESLVSAIDKVIASIDYVLTGFVENLEFEAGAGSRSGTGNTLDNILTGNESANTLRGATGNDTLQGGVGDDTLAGGTGSDTAIFSGNRSAYALSLGSDGTLTVSGTDGTDSLTSIESLQFEDGTLGLTQAIPPQLETARHHAKVEAYFLGVLGREATTDEASQFTTLLQANQGRVWWYDTAQSTQSGSLMSYLISRPEYTTLTSTSNSEIVGTVFIRLTGQSASQDIIDHYVERLDAGTLQAQGVVNKMLGELYLSPKSDGSLGTVAGFQDNREYLGGAAYRGYLDRLDAITGIDIANLDDTSGCLVELVGVTG